MTTAATLTPQPACTLLTNINGLMKQWCVYEHMLHDPVSNEAPVIYIGACLLREVYSYLEAQRNSEWCKIVTEQSHLFVRITQTGDREDCMRKATALIHAQQPRCNVLGYSTIGMIRPILCSNGMTYNTQTEACEALGLNQGALSRHLAGNKGVKSCKGLTFVYKDVVR